MENGKIGSVLIVGMGALGLLFGDEIRTALGEETVTYLMDEARLARHEKDRYSVNGREVKFRMISPASCGRPADLVIVATKYGGLREAMEEMAGFVGPDTVIIPLLNGIIAEQILAEKHGIDVPVNRRYLQVIREREAKYGN